MKNHVRGTYYYEMTTWLLEMYQEFKYYRLSDTDNEEDNRVFNLDDVLMYIGGDSSKYMRCFLADNLEFTDILLHDTDDAFEEFERKDPIRARIIDVYYLNSDYRDMSVGDKISLLGYTNCGFYKNLYRSVAGFSYELWKKLKLNDKLPFGEIDEKASFEIIRLMREANEMHEHGNICYMDTEKLLKNYLSIKYEGVRERLSETELRVCENYGLTGGIYEFYEVLDKITYMNVDDRIKGWLFSSMAENTGAYVYLIDSAANVMKTLGKRGEDNYNYIKAVFMEPEFSDKKWELRKDALGLSQRVYYCRRNQAISMMSKILWGVLGHRHTESIFYVAHENKE